MGLRPYQVEAVDAVEREWGAGNRRTLLVQATGTGKTIVMAELARRVADRGGRTLILAHRGELLTQAADKIGRFTGLSCAVEKAGETCVGTWNSVTVGSVQTLMRGDRLDALAPDRFDVVMVDEAHHALADGYVRILDHFAGADVLGVTATPDRSDQKDLGQVFDSLAYEYGLAKAVKDGWLCPIEAQTLPVSLDVSGVSIQAGDYSAGQLGDALDPYLDAIADAMAAEGLRDRHTVVFLPLVRTAKAFRDRLCERGFRAAEVDGQSDDREEVLRDFDAGRYDVLCNSMLLTEGWDCPAVDCIVVLRPTKSRSLYAQMVGRGTRLSPDTGKSKLLLLDFLWLTGRHELCRPASLVASRAEVADRMTEIVAEDGCPVDLEECEVAAEDDVQRQREEALADELHRLRHRKARLVDPIQFELSICDHDLQDYVPAFAWQQESPTDAQAHALEAWGVDPDSMDAGKASLMLDRLSKRKAAGMASPKQVRMLERKGFQHPGTWTKEQAGDMMSRLSANGWRVPFGITPATYTPQDKEMEEARDAEPSLRP